MADTWQQVYEDSFSSAAINAGASETFGGDEATRSKHLKYGSANSLVLSSLADENFRIVLDGNSRRVVGILQPRGAFTIKAEDGVFFDTLQVVNLDGTNASADEVKVRIARSIPVR